MGGLFTMTYVEQVSHVLKWVIPLLVVNHIGGIWMVFPQRPSQSEKAVDIGLLTLVLVAGLASVLLPYWYGGFTSYRTASAGAVLWNYAIIIGTGVAFAGSVAAVALPWLRRENQFGPFLLAVAATGLICGNGTSAGLSEISCFVGLGLFLAFLAGLRHDFFIGKVAIFLLGFSLIAHLAGKKYDVPYDWWSLTQGNIRSPAVEVGVPEMAGFRLSPDSARVFSEVSAAIKTHTARGDNILAFPHIPAFYVLSDRWPSLMGVVHWFDFLPDDKAELEAKRLLQAPPKMILALDLPEKVWASHETLFRQGRRSGQRSVREAIEELTTGNNYVLLQSYPIPTDCTLRVWLRR